MGSTRSYCSRSGSRNIDEYHTEYYTAIGKRPINTIVRQSGTGHATMSLRFGGGMESTLLSHTCFSRRYMGLVSMCRII